MDAANAHRSPSSETAAGLSERDREILEFERQLVEVRRRQGAGGPREVRHVLHPLLPGPQRAHRPSRGARGRPAAGPPAAPAAGRPASGSARPAASASSLTPLDLSGPPTHDWSPSPWPPSPAPADPASRRRDERGVAFPSPLVMLVGPRRRDGLGHLRRHPRPGARPSAASTRPRSPAPTRRPSAEPTPTAPRRRRREPKPKPQVERGEVYVEVFNNSGITGPRRQHRHEGHRRRLARRRRATTGTAPSPPPPSTTRRGSRPPASSSPSTSASSARRAGRRRDEARPAHGHPHRRRPALTPAPSPVQRGQGRRTCAHVVGLTHGVHLRRRRAPTTTPSRVARRRASSGSTSTARCRRSSTTPRRPACTPTAAGALLELAEVVRAVAVITGRPARQASPWATSTRSATRCSTAAPSSSSSASTATSAGRPPSSGSGRRARPRDWRASSASCRRPAQRRRRRGVRRGEGPRGRGAHPPPGRPGRRLRAAGAARSPPSPSATTSAIEPGRNVIEVRSGDMHKGHAPAGLRRGAGGHRRASSAVTTSATSRPSRRSARCAPTGLPGLVVCSASTEQPRPGPARRRRRRRTRRASWSS